MREAVEAMARAIDRQLAFEVDSTVRAHELTRDEQMSVAQAALAALTASGFAVVPVEPSRAMVDAFVARALQVTVQGEGGWSEYARNQWAQMLAAANKEPNDDE